MSRKIILVLGAVVFLVGCTQKNEDAKKTTSFVPEVKIVEECLATETCDFNLILSEQVDSIEFKEKIDSNEYIVIDVRTPGEYNEERIPGDVLNVDFHDSDFLEEIAKLDRNEKYLIYCRSDNRSGQAIKMMEEMDFFDLVELEGGIIAWKNAGFDVVQ